MHGESVRKSYRAAQDGAVGNKGPKTLGRGCDALAEVRAAVVLIVSIASINSAKNISFTSVALGGRMYFSVFPL